MLDLCGTCSNDPQSNGRGLCFLPHKLFLGQLCCDLGGHAIIFGSLHFKFVTTQLLSMYMKPETSALFFGLLKCSYYVRFLLCFCVKRKGRGRPEKKNISSSVIYCSQSLHLYVFKKNSQEIREREQQELELLSHANK